MAAAFSAEVLKLWPLLGYKLRPTPGISWICMELW